MWKPLANAGVKNFERSRIIIIIIEFDIVHPNRLIIINKSNDKFNNKNISKHNYCSNN